MKETNKIVLTDINLPFESLLKLSLQMIGVQIVIVFLLVFPGAILWWLLSSG